MTNDTPTSADGFLAIWSDVAPEIETDYLHWLTREHTQERLGVPGFLAVRVFRALGVEARRYFILYTLRDATVLGSEAYLARLNAPTPWSQRIMPQLKNFARGGGRKVAQSGSGHGGTIAALRFDAALAPDLQARAAALVTIDRVVAVRLYETDLARTAIRTNEKGMRIGDTSFAGLMLIEALDEAALRAAIDVLRPAVAAGEPTTAYATIFALQAETLRALAERRSPD